MAQVQTHHLTDVQKLVAGVVGAAGAVSESVQALAAGWGAEEGVVELEVGLEKGAGKVGEAGVVEEVE